jgi:WD40 repeat protein/outer membrane protein OmpA-like peptidoglycan-associated protein/tetratricopeptide (TPR) repeat protein
LFSGLNSFGQSGDIKTVTDEEFNQELEETKEEKAKRLKKITKKSAMTHYWNGNFRAGLDEFLILLSNDPQNVEINFYIGACYLESNIDKTKAIGYLEYAVQQDKFPREAIYQLGRAYMFAHRFDEAITTFNKYKDIGRGDNDNIISGGRMIEQCFNAKELVKYPLDATFENLGPNINTAYPEFNPFIPEDESFIVFTTKRPDCLGLQLDFDGFKTPDIFRAREYRGYFREARNIGSAVNTEWYEEVVGISADGQELLVYIDNFDGYDDIYVSPRKGRFFDDYLDLGRNINSDAIETTASLHTSGDLVFFSREKGKGATGTDLYMSRRLPNRDWGIPQKLPDIINTRYNESFPHLLADGKTFYFCSEGHASMGGFDIFISEYDKLTNTFSPPKNAGYPINTVDDDFNLSLSTTGRYGYISQFRFGEGYGERDIYRITFNDVDPVWSIVRGSITNIKDSMDLDPEMDIGTFEMTVTDMNSDKYIGTYRPNMLSSNYATVLEPGEYCVYVEGELYFDTTSVVEVMDKSSHVSEIIKNYTLRPDPDAIRRKRTGAKYGGLIYAMSGSDDGKAKIWDLPSGKQMLSLDNKNDVSSVAFGPYGKRALSATDRGDINIWSLPDGTQQITLKGHTRNITQAIFTNDGRYVLSASADSTIRLWNVETGLMEKIYIGHLDKVNGISLSPDGNYFVSCSDDSNVLMWELMTEELVGIFEGHSGPVKSATFSPRGNFIVTGGQDGMVKKWDASSAQEVLEFKLHSSQVNSVEVSPDGSTVVSGSNNGFVYVWDATSAEVKHVLLGHDKPVSSVFISKDAKYIISGSKEREPITWEYKTGNEVTPLSGHRDVINDVCFSPYVKFPEKKTLSKMDLFEEIKGDLIEAQPDALEEEIVRLEMELAAMEAQKVLGYDPTLLDSDVYDKKELKVGQKIILERIYFDFDKSDIRNESVVELNKLLLFLEKNSTVIVEISGHTDSRGSDEYNLKLSKNRAKSVVAWLKKRKMSSKRVIAKGYGESKHIAPNENPDGTDNPEGRQMNRRIELTIIGVGGEQIITTEGK